MFDVLVSTDVWVDPTAPSMGASYNVRISKLALGCLEAAALSWQNTNASRGMLLTFCTRQPMVGAIDVGCS